MPQRCEARPDTAGNAQPAGTGAGRNHSQSSETGGPLLLTADAHQKVNAAHLRRNAYLYIRQSTLRQVFENSESTKRQYALRDRAMALGWTLDRIITIDSDLGLPGASA